MPSRTYTEFEIIADDAIEAWATTAHPNPPWRNHVWPEKTPKSDGHFTQGAWRSATATIVESFNNEISPMSVHVTRKERNAAHEHKLKAFRSFLAQKAVAAQAKIAAKEALK